MCPWIGWALPAESHNLTWMCYVWCSREEQCWVQEGLWNFNGIFLNSAEHQASLKTLFVPYDMGTFGWLVVINNFNKVPMNSNRIDTQRVKIFPEMAFQSKFHSYSLINTGLVSVLQTRGEKPLMRWGWQGLVQLMYPSSLAFAAHLSAFTAELYGFAEWFLERLQINIQ